MENKILDLLEKMNDRQERMEENLVRMDDRQHNMETKLEQIDDRQHIVEAKLDRIDDKQHKMEDKLDQVFDTVKRIEASQKDDVLSLLKLQKKNLDFEVDYVNNRLTEMDKRLFHLEKRVEN